MKRIQRKEATVPHSQESAGPITPGSPLYRLLQLVAQAVAHRLRESTTETSAGPATPPPPEDGRQASGSDS